MPCVFIAIGNIPGVRKFRDGIIRRKFAARVLSMKRCGNSLCKRRSGQLRQHCRPFSKSSHSISDRSAPKPSAPRFKILQKATETPYRGELPVSDPNSVSGVSGSLVLLRRCQRPLLKLLFVSKKGNPIRNQRIIKRAEYDTMKTYV